MVALFGQDAEAGGELFAGEFGVAFDGGDGDGDGGAFEIRFVEIAGVAHLPREQLDHQVAVAEGEEVGGERGARGWGLGARETERPLAIRPQRV